MSKNMIQFVGISVIHSWKLPASIMMVRNIVTVSRLFRCLDVRLLIMRCCFPKSGECSTNVLAFFNLCLSSHILIRLGMICLCVVVCVHHITGPLFS